jgi:threonine dehydratase
MAVSLYLAMVQNARTRARRTSAILTFKDHDIKVVTSFKYLGSAINNTNYKQKESKLES